MNNARKLILNRTREREKKGNSTNASRPSTNDMSKLEIQLGSNFRSASEQRAKKKELKYNPVRVTIMCVTRLRALKI